MLKLICVCAKNAPFQLMAKFSLLLNDTGIATLSLQAVTIVVVSVALFRSYFVTKF